VTGTLGVDRLGNPVGVANEGTAVGTAPPGTEVVACGRVGARVAVGAGVLNGTWTICPFGGVVSTGACGVGGASTVTPSTGIR